MSKTPDPMVRRDASTARRLRRFPGLTRADLSLLQALEPAQARAMESEIRRQNHSDRQFARKVTLECDMGADPALIHGYASDAIDHIGAASQARFTYGAGGGRQRPTFPTDGSPLGPT